MRVRRMRDCGQRGGVFRSRVILGNDQVHTLVTGVGMKILIRNWEPRLFMILEVVQNLETKGQTIQKSVFHEGRGVTERSVDETRIAVGGLDDPGLLRGGVLVVCVDIAVEFKVINMFVHSTA